MKGARKKSPEDWRSKKKAGGHFADYTRLADPLKDPANDPSHEEYRAKGDDQLIKVHLFRAAANSFDKCFTILAKFLA